MISTIIPSFNRAHSLDRTIESYIRQTLPAKLHELVVVDNNSNDNTRAVVERWQKDSVVSIKYHFEKRQGVHYARNTGYRVSSGDLLYFTDDDISFNPNLLEAYLSKFQQNSALVAATGPIIPVWETAPPDWLLELIGNQKSFPTLSIRDDFEEDHYSVDLYLYSCNLVIRREMFEKRGGFHPEFTGEIWIGDGENGLNKAMKEARDLTGYFPEASVHHHIPASRTTKRYYVKRRGFEGAVDAYAKFRDQEHWDDLGIRGEIFNSLSSMVAEKTKEKQARLSSEPSRALYHRGLAAAYSVYAQYFCHLKNNSSFVDFVRFDDWLAVEVPDPPTDICFCDPDDFRFLANV